MVGFLAFIRYDIPYCAILSSNIFVNPSGIKGLVTFTGSSFLPWFFPGLLPAFAAAIAPAI